MIYLPTTLPSGTAASYHHVIKAEIDIDNNELLAIVCSWPDETSMQANIKSEMSAYPLPTTAYPDIEGALIAGTTPFTGGTISTATNTTLDIARARKWIDIRTARDAAIYGGFTWTTYNFDSTPTSQQQIMGAVQLATLAASQSQPFTITWTLADNSTVDLTGDQMIQVGVTLGAWVQAQFAKGVALRAQIATATDMTTITWQ